MKFAKLLAKVGLAVLTIVVAVDVAIVVIALNV